MVDSQQDLGKGSQIERPKTLGEVALEISSQLARGFMEKRLNSGKGIEIPSLGMTITPGRDLVNTDELTAEEKARFLSP